MMKDLVMEVTRDVTNEMPENATAEEILKAIIIRIGALKGFSEIEKGNYTTQEELLKEIEQW